MVTNRQLRPIERAVQTSDLDPINRDRFGIELPAVEIATVGDDYIDDLQHLLAHHGVVVLQDRSLGDAEFVNFLQRLGALTFTAGERSVPDAPWLNIVSNVGRTQPPRSVFHTDTSYVARPPAYTALKAVSLPSAGGETLFSNQYLAYETLPPSVKQQLATAKVLHVATGITPANSESQSWQPLFRRHPISGRISLFLSTPERCQSIGGWDSAYSQHALRLLYQHSIRPARLYRHHWRSGDIVIWDNRCTMHRADHSQVVGDRILHRGLVAGEAPRSAFD